jgi:hypothetical protein
MGYSYINFQRRIETSEDGDVIIAGYQFRLENPVTREGIEELIKDYPELAGELDKEII